ncbi:MAG: reverse transcriptase/maturase family protein [Methylovulum sp.]|nr:reverse transcriptase/maturase family protein [Methylovulum sp.]
MQQLSLFDAIADLRPTLALSELFEAYFDCRSNKRNTLNALAFEVDYEANLLKLCAQINDGSYQPGKSIAFIVNQPVKREIFAADFRDRVVHHLIVSKLNPLFEKTFIYDSYACRTGKGTHLGIQRVDRFIRQCSQNYSTDCYVLKLDVKGFFMHINKTLLFAELQAFIEQKYLNTDKALLLELCQKIIDNDPTKNCTVKSKRSAWQGLPPDKSLFHSATHCGLPIGNLTSQVFANFYMNRFDHFIKHDLGIRYYGRYVDDFILVHQDKAYLKSLIPLIKTTLQEQLQLTLHPNKIYLQHYSKGVQFLGAIIKPQRIYIAKRTQGNFYMAIEKHNALVIEHKPSKEQQAAFLSSMNSYLGIMKHYKTHQLRKRMLFKNLSGWWWRRVYLSGGMTKFVLKEKSAATKAGIFRFIR